ncbi:Sensor kinase CusS [compost metagenome]
MEAVIFEKGLSLVYEIEPGLMVTGSGEQLKQVVLILLDNAVKYNIPQGTVRLRLQKTQGSRVQLVVSNTGAGIPQEHVDRIFDRFYRADPSRSRQNGGYGLGLAIAKSIVEQHRGEIYAKSSPQETDFYVVLG